MLKYHKIYELYGLDLRDIPKSSIGRKLWPEDLKIQIVQAAEKAKEKGLNFADFGDQIGIPPSQLHQWRKLYGAEAEEAEAIDVAARSTMSSASSNEINGHDFSDGAPMPPIKDISSQIAQANIALAEDQPSVDPETQPELFPQTPANTAANRAAEAALLGRGRAPSKESQRQLERARRYPPQGRINNNAIIARRAKPLPVVVETQELGEESFSFEASSVQQAIKVLGWMMEAKGRVKITIVDG